MIRATLGLFLCLALLSPAQTTDQSTPATTSAAMQLAARISSLLPRRATASLDFRNLTTFPVAEWSNFQSRLRDELRQAGVETAGVQAVTTPLETHVRVTLSEGSRGLLLVADISAGENRQVAMLPWDLPSPTPSKLPVVLSQQPLWTQAEPILDILMVDSGMLVLSPHQVASFKNADGKWAPAAVASLMLPRPMPRDPRGRVEATSGGFRAYLPAGTCEGMLPPELRLTCSKDIAVWQSMPVRWVADRNVLEPERDERASIADPCVAGTVEIASSPNNEHDSVRAYQMVNGQAVPMSDPLPLPGPVTALWPAESGPESGKVATLVVHNLQTGEYEASRLGVACNR